MKSCDAGWLDIDGQTFPKNVFKKYDFNISKNI